MINRAHELLPQSMIDECLRLYRLDPDWVEVIDMDDGVTYKIRNKYPTWLRRALTTPSDIFGTFATSVWLGTGPKIARPTKEHCEALENVSVNIFPGDYTQPFPALLIDLHHYPVGPYKAVLAVHWKAQYILIQLFSRNSTDDILTTISPKSCNIPLEETINTFDEDCRDVAPTAARALRIALNLCLAMTHFGCHHDYLLPKVVANDRHLARENSERGARARERLKLALSLVNLDHKAQLANRPHPPKDGEPIPTGREMPCHWRRGHWAMQAHGPQHSLRKRIFRAPRLIRADRMDVPPDADHSTIYQ